jgi:hypothetical protein
MIFLFLFIQSFFFIPLGPIVIFSFHCCPFARIGVKVRKPPIRLPAVSFFCRMANNFSVLVRRYFLPHHSPFLQQLFKFPVFHRHWFSPFLFSSILPQMLFPTSIQSSSNYQNLDNIDIGQMFSIQQKINLKRQDKIRLNRLCS